MIAGQRDKAAGKIHFPVTVGADKVVVIGLRLVFQLQITGSAGDPGGGTVLFDRILWKLVPDCLLEFNRQVGVNGQNLRK